MRLLLEQFALLFSSTLWASEPLKVEDANSKAEAVSEEFRVKERSYAATTEPQRAPACKSPEYPAASIRNDEQGIVNASFLIGIDGNVIDKKIVKSSGFINLDNAVLDALGKCRFKPAMVDGVPEQAWQPIHYVWSLK